MRLVFPTNENNGTLSKRGAHFGKANFYTIVTIENGVVIDVEGVVNSGHESGACTSAVANIIALSPDVLIVGGIGGSPAAGFAKVGLTVYSDQSSQTVQESINLFSIGELTPINGNGTCSTH